MARRRRFRPLLRSLETRVVPATFTVLNLLNAGPDSLRNCIQSANTNAGADTVDFAPGLAGTIMLTGGDIAISSDDIAIVGPGAKTITVNGAGVSRVFNFSPAPFASVHSVSGLTIAGGKTTTGGGIQIGDETLTLTDCAITGNTATGQGGGIDMAGAGRLLMFSCTLSGNSAAANGGGINVNGPAAVLEQQQCTLSGNSSGASGGAIAHASNLALSISNTTITGNSAFLDGGGVFANIITVESCIVAGNVSDSPPVSDFTASTVVANVSAIGSKVGIGTFNADATTLALLGQNFKLGALADNGGPLLTHLPGSTSPVRDLGSNTGGATTDQRGPGFPRTWNASPDIGAVELAPLFIVRNDNDSGRNSLRQQILDANAFVGPNVISFDPASFGATDGTITLTTGEIAISEGLTLVGPGAGLATVSGNNASRVFNTAAAADGASIALSGLTITGGHSVDGGGINIGQEVVSIADCVITGNTSTGDGGGINVESLGALSPAALTVTGSTISGNTAADDGGGVYFRNGGSGLFVNCILSNNRATGQLGGGLYFFGTVGPGGLTVRNTTITSNIAGTSGGGIVLTNFTGMLLVQNSTIVANTASAGSGGGGIARTSGGGHISLESTIVFSNTATLNSNEDLFSTGSVSASFCAIGTKVGVSNFSGNSTTTALLGQDIKLGPLADNGGATMTFLPLFGSPLIDAGTNPAGVTNDQRGPGYGRLRGAGVDIGAVEHPSNFVVTNTKDAGAGSLRQAVTDADTFVGFDIVVFDYAVFTTDQTITLASPIAIYSGISIIGIGAHRTTINANGTGRIFNTSFAPAGTKVLISGLTLTGGNEAMADGGAILIGNETVFIGDCALTNNSATNGGAILVTAGDLTIDNCTLSSNTASGGSGGGVNFQGAGNLVVRNSTFSANSNPGGAGGGLVVESHTGLAKIFNSTFTLNSSLAGGGLARFGGTSTIDVWSSIVSGNSAVTGPDAATSGALDARNSLFGSSAGISMFTTDAVTLALLGQGAKIGPLADNGGRTFTHALQSGSPAIGKGSNVPALEYDQRGFGFPRSINGAVDIGAVEAFFPAKINLVTIGAGAQRSNVSKIVVAFDSIVEFLVAPDNAFVVSRQTPALNATDAAAVDNTNGFTIVTLTFTGGAVDGKSLADGRYTLTVHASDFIGPGLDGNGDGMAGDNFTLVGDPALAPKLFRLFGDADGDGDVDSIDFGAFRAVFGAPFIDFDFDDDGDVDISDFGAFRARFGITI